MRKPRLSRDTIEKLYNGEHIVTGKYEYYTEENWNDELNAYEETLYRENNETYERDEWKIGWKGIWEFEVDKDD